MYIYIYNIYIYMYIYICIHTYIFHNYMYIIHQLAFMLIKSNHKNNSEKETDKFLKPFHLIKDYVNEKSSFSDINVHTS